MSFSFAERLDERRSLRGRRRRIVERMPRTSQESRDREVRIDPFTTIIDLNRSEL